MPGGCLVLCLLSCSDSMWNVRGEELTLVLHYPTRCGLMSVSGVADVVFIVILSPTFLGS